jgi:hypothetical protein
LRKVPAGDKRERDKEGILQLLMKGRTKPEEEKRR